MTTKTSLTNSFRILQDNKILIGVLVIVVLLAGGWWVWDSYYQCSDRNPQFCNRNCNTDSDCYPACTRSCGCLALGERCLSSIKCEVPPFSCRCVSNSCEITEREQVTLTTDKTEYEYGDTVKMSIKNGSNNTIFSHFDYCGGTPFWILQKYSGDQWESLDFSFPSLIADEEVCDFVLCEQTQPEELKAGLEITDQGVIGNICEWPEQPIGVPATEPQSFSPGTYRLSFFYGLDREGADLLVETKTIYSNEFRIKEKSGGKAPEKSDIEKFLPAPEVGGVRVYVKTVSGTIKQGELVEEKVIFDSTMDETEFYLFWGESLATKSDLGLVIVRPDGTLIDESTVKTDPEIEFASGPGYEFYKGVIAWSREKSAWLYGEWRVRIFGKSVPSGGESYTFEVPTSDAMNYSINLDKESYLVGEPIKIEAAIEDLFLDVTESQYIFGMSIQIEIESPSQDIYHLILYDDGVHSDGEANDGIYANIFSNTSLQGRYKFKLTVSGLNNRHRQPFTRECFFFTEVKPKS